MSICMRRVAIAAFVLGGAPLAAQQSEVARCDSIIAAARVDSVDAGLFLRARAVEGPLLDGDQRHEIVVTVGAALVPPTPFRLNVFSGPPRASALRVRGADTTTALRAPTMTGVYRFTATANGLVRILVIRAALMSGFDSAAVEAIRTAASANPAFASPVGVDSMHVDIEFSTDSSTGARRLVSGSFPRMPVIDATPLANNKPPVFPDAAKADSIETGDVVLRFVVERDGTPDFDTIELVRSTAPSLTRAALLTLADHRFRPATIHGCTIAQQIDYAFNFSAPLPWMPPHS
jgi:TonB family protein